MIYIVNYSYAEMIRQKQAFKTKRFLNLRISCKYISLKTLLICLYLFLLFYHLSYFVTLYFISFENLLNYRYTKIFWQNMLQKPGFLFDKYRASTSYRLGPAVYHAFYYISYPVCIMLNFHRAFLFELFFETIIFLLAIKLNENYLKHYFPFICNSLKLIINDGYYVFENCQLS